MGRETEKSPAGILDFSRIGNIHQLDEISAELDQAVCGPKRMYSPRGRGEAKRLPGCFRSSEVVDGNDHMVDVADGNVWLLRNASMICVT